MEPANILQAVFNKGCKNTIILLIALTILMPLVSSEVINASDGFPIVAADWRGIACNDSDIFVLSDTKDAIYDYSYSGVNLSNGFGLNLGGTTGIAGLGWNYSDFWYFITNAHWIDHSNRFGENLSNGISSDIELGGVNIRGIYSNGTDLWVDDLNNNFINHLNRTGSNQSDGFDIASIGCEDPKGISSTSRFNPPDDFWIYDEVDKFMYHVDNKGNNLSDGFSTHIFRPVEDITGVCMRYSPQGDLNFYVLDKGSDWIYHGVSYNSSAAIYNYSLSNAPKSAGSSETVIFKIIINSSKVNNSLAYLYFNGNLYTPDSNETGDNQINFSKSLQMPVIYTPTLNYSYYWSLSIAGQSNTTNSDNVTVFGSGSNLTFWTDNTLNATSGECSDAYNNTGFINQTTWYISKSNFTGITSCYIGMNQLGSNWTQYYEFDMETIGNLSEDIQRLKRADAVMYFKITDTGGSPLSGAKLRFYMSNSSANQLLKYNLLGQRLTMKTGTSFIILDSQTQVKLEVTKDGYQPAVINIRAGDMDDYATLATALDIQMVSSNASQNNLWLYMPKRFSNRGQTLNGVLYTVTDKSVTYNTSHSSYLSTLTNDGYDRYAIALSCSLGHFACTGVENVTTYIYIGGDYFAQATSEYIGGTVVEVIKEPTEAMDEGIKKVLYLIGIMVIAFLAGLMFHSETIGKTIFMAGGVISPLVSLDFVWLCGTCVIYYAMIMAKGVYSRD